MTYETILTQVEDGVGILSLNQPDRLNAMGPTMAHELADALHAFPLQGARAVLLRAEGKGFCSGADLQTDGGIPEDLGLMLEQVYNPAIEIMMASSLPIVAAVQGPCAGIGVSFALAADFVVATRNAYFLQAFINLGLVPDGGATWILPRLVGRARAMEMMMLGERVSAEKALAWGMIHKVVCDLELQNEALSLAKRLARGPTVAYGLIRRGMAKALETGFTEALAVERDHQAAAGRTEDFKAGITGFLTKTSPKFRGQ